MFCVYDLEVFCCLVTRHLTRVLIGVRDADGQMLTFVGSVDKPGANYLRSLDSVQCKSDSKLKNNNRKKMAWVKYSHIVNKIEEKNVNPFI